MSKSPFRLSIVAALALGANALAATISVTSTNDSGLGSLRDAVANAGSGDTINFDPSVTGTITLTSGELLIDKSLTVAGPGQSQLAISGNSNSRVFEIAAGSYDVTISGLSITKGRGGMFDLFDSFGNNVGFAAGGGLLNQSTGLVTLTNCTFAGNTAQDPNSPTFAEGGAILNASTGTLNISGCDFTSNMAQFLTYNTGPDTGALYIGSHGGAVANRGGILSITSSVFKGNQANAGTITLPGAFIDVVGGAAGGAIYTTAYTPAGVSASGQASIDRCTISGNSVSGATYQNNLANSNDHAAEGGGFLGVAGFTISNTAIVGNQVFGPQGAVSSDTDGGGMVDSFPYDFVTLINCTVAGNSVTAYHVLAAGETSNPAAAQGGGIWNEDGVTITYCTIANNTTTVILQQSVNGSLQNAGTEQGTGGGVYNFEPDAGIILRDTIIASNTAEIGPDIAAGPVISQGYNLIGDGTGAVITGGTADQIGSASSPVDPKLGPLADNGGPTMTMALLPGSPAIDHGGAVAGVTSDQRGLPRPYDFADVANASGGDGSDIGAFELSRAAQLLNISTRMEVLTGNNVLIGGFIITGSDDKKVMARALGPSLPVSGPLADPVLELHNSSITIATNDNWKVNDATGQSQQADIEATGIPPSNDLESALVTSLPANGSAYTAVVRGKNNGTGIGLVEIYDLARSANSQLANISTRGFVDTGDNVMIGGFISGNASAPSRVIVRGIGPSLGIDGELQDPTLELHDKNGTLIASNDNWQDDSNAAKVLAAGIGPKDPRECAIYTVLQPGTYTAIVRGVNNTTGIGLVEVYNLQ